MALLMSAPGTERTLSFVGVIEKGRLYTRTIEAGPILAARVVEYRGNGNRNGCASRKGIVHRDLNPTIFPSREKITHAKISTGFWAG